MQTLKIKSLNSLSPTGDGYYTITYEEIIGTSIPVTFPIVVPIPPTLPGYQIISKVIDWDAHNGKSFYPPMGCGQVYTFAFKTGNTSSGIGNVGFSEYAGSTPIRTVVISESPADFNYDTNPAAIGKSGAIYFTVGTRIRGYPMLKPNTQYYINFKNESNYAPGVDTCNPGENCGFAITLNH